MSEKEKELAWKPTIKEFTNEYFAVFNTRTHLEKQAVKITTNVYGKWRVARLLKPMLKTGVMGVFQKPPNEVSVFFVLTLSKITDDYHKRRKKNERSKNA